jgi:transposase
LTNEQWAQLEPLLPPQKPKTGRPNAEHRRMLNGRLWILHTGAPWRDLPEHYGPWRSVASRFYRWRESGVWDRALSALQVQANAEGRLDWEVHLVDPTIVRAHQHAAGAKKSAGESAEGRAAVEALGYSQRGFPTKVHRRAEGQGKAMVMVLTPGQQHEATVFEALLEQGAVHRPGRGRPWRRPRRVIGDKSYSTQRIRGYLRQRGISYLFDGDKLLVFVLSRERLMAKVLSIPHLNEIIRAYRQLLCKPLVAVAPDACPPPEGQPLWQQTDGSLLIVF